MKHKGSFVFVYIWIAALMALAILVCAFARREPVESETENRMLAGVPVFSFEAVTDGSFMTGVEDWLSDAMLGRSEIVLFSSKVMDMFSIGKSGGNSQAVQEALGGEYEPEPNVTDDVREAQASERSEEIEIVFCTNKPTSTPVPPDVSEAPATPTPTFAAAIVTAAPSPTMTMGQDELRQMYKIKTDGSHSRIYAFAYEAVTNAIDTLEEVLALLPSDGLVYYVQSPDSDIALEVTQSGKYSGWGSDVEAVVDAGTDSRIIVLSVMDILNDRLMAGERLYFDTDHHWTPRAACYVMQALLERANVPTLDYNDYDYTVSSTFRGSLVIDDPALAAKTHPDTIEILNTRLPVQSYTTGSSGVWRESIFMDATRNGYSAYLGGTRGPWRRFVTGSQTGRSCLVICNSFGNAFIPYLCPYYDEVHSVDLREDYFSWGSSGLSIEEYIDKYDIDEVFFVLTSGGGFNGKYFRQLVPKYLTR